MAEPADPQLIAPDPASEDGLASAVPDEQLPLITVGADEPPPPGRSWAFDFNGTPGFKRSGGSGPQETTGAATIIGWVDKYLHTQRGAMPVHPPWFGLRNPLGPFGLPVTELSVSELQEDMAGMTNHPHIADVVNVRLLTDPTSEVAYVLYTVVLDPPVDALDLLNLRTSLEL